MMAGAMYIDHINIRAPADLLSEVRRFYIDMLGLEEGFRPGFGNTGHWLYSDGRAIVHLSRDDSGETVTEDGAPVSSHLDHVSFRLTGARALVDRLGSAGIPHRSHYLADVDITQVFFRDPAGILLEASFVNEQL